MYFRGREGILIITEMEIAKQLNLQYSYVASWITLTVHSPLEAVGFTAPFSKALSKNEISCNVVAA
ncbi:hypothetical protein ACE939_08340 [Aquimarina sp. W85]|uniref:hypothetical protein n=1 Tax=Aquimarina rhodophyticola TaxID=3342246 RepID=UPI00366C4D6C